MGSYNGSMGQLVGLGCASMEIEIPEMVISK